MMRCAINIQTGCARRSGGSRRGRAHMPPAWQSSSPGGKQRAARCLHGWQGGGSRGAYSVPALCRGAYDPMQLQRQLPAPARGHPTALPSGTPCGTADLPPTPSPTFADVCAVRVLGLELGGGLLLHIRALDGPVFEALFARVGTVLWHRHCGETWWMWRPWGREGRLAAVNGVEGSACTMAAVGRLGWSGAIARALTRAMPWQASPAAAAPWRCRGGPNTRLLPNCALAH